SRGSRSSLKSTVCLQRPFRHWMLHVACPFATHSAGLPGGKCPAHFVDRRRQRIPPSKRRVRHLANYRFLAGRNAREPLPVVGVETRPTGFTLAAFRRIWSSGCRLSKN